MKWVGLILCIIIMLVLPACNGKLSPAIEHLNQGDAYYLQQQWVEALNEYDKAKELDPALDVDSKMAQVYFERARSYDIENEYEDVITDCCKALELDPALEPGMVLAIAYNSRGRQYSEQEDLAVPVAGDAQPLVLF